MHLRFPSHFYRNDPCTVSYTHLAQLYEIQSKYYREKTEMNHTDMSKFTDREQTKFVYRKGEGRNVSE